MSNCVMLLYELILMRKMVKVDTQELYNFTVWVAQSPRTVKDETVRAIEKFLKAYPVKLED